jgi:Putative rhamnosyl transferase
MAQQDQSFNWVVLVDDGLPSDIRKELDKMLRPFRNRAFLSTRVFHTPESLVEEGRRISGKSPYLLTARIDDDDAWNTDMVRAVRGKVSSWLKQPNRGPGLSFTFQDGLEWIMYEMYDVHTLRDSGERTVHSSAIRRFQLPFMSMSVFVCSLFSDGATAMSGAHSRVAENLSSTKGFATEVITTDSPMWLHCRHKQASSGIRKASGEEVHPSLRDLAAHFGIDDLKVKSYLDHAAEHEYALVKEPIGRKRKILFDLMLVDRDIKNPATTAADLAHLRQVKEELTDKLTRLEVDVLGNPNDFVH